MSAHFIRKFKNAKLLKIQPTAIGKILIVTMPVSMKAILKHVGQ